MSHKIGKIAVVAVMSLSLTACKSDEQKDGSASGDVKSSDWVSYTGSPNVVSDSDSSTSTGTSTQTSFPITEDEDVKAESKSSKSTKKEESSKESKKEESANKEKGEQKDKASKVSKASVAVTPVNPTSNGWTKSSKVVKKDAASTKSEKKVKPYKKKNLANVGATKTVLIRGASNKPGVVTLSAVNEEAGTSNSAEVTFSKFKHIKVYKYEEKNAFGVYIVNKKTGQLAGYEARKYGKKFMVLETYGIATKNDVTFNGLVHGVGSTMYLLEGSSKIDADGDVLNSSIVSDKLTKDLVSNRNKAKWKDGKQKAKVMSVPKQKKKG